MGRRESATVINEKTFSQVPDKDKVRLDTHGNQLGLTGAKKHPLDIVGVFKIRMVVPDLGAILPVVIVIVVLHIWQRFLAYHKKKFE